MTRWLVRSLKAITMELTRSASRPKFSRHLSVEAEEKNLLTLAVCQMTSRGDKDANFDVCRRLICKAKHRGAKMVFLPEAFDYIAADKEQTKEMAESLDGQLIQKYKALARDNQMWISLGGLHEKGPDVEFKRIYNAHVVLNDEGNIMSVYRKVHLFDVTLQSGQKLHESQYVIPGSTIVPPVDSPVGKIGLGICYDVRFPEFSIALTQMGAEVLTYPSAFTVATGLAHWEVLLRCRAVENQCYVVAAAQTGYHNERRESFGHAMVVDPWGAIIAQCHEGTDVACADIDLAFLHKIRRDMPVWFHRRNELYDALQYENEVINESDVFQFGQVSVKPEQVFLKTKYSFAFVNHRPVLPGHVLLSPIRITKRITDLSREELTDLFSCVQKVQALIEQKYGASSSTIAVQDGVDAGQSINHVHVHLLPRKPGDFKQTDQVYDELQKHDKDDRLIRTDQEMAEEAAQLRKFLLTTR